MQKSSFVSTLLALPFAFVMIFAGVLGKYVAWPILKWTGLTSWSLIKKLFQKTSMHFASKRLDAIAVRTLPTPDVFKGASNLARAKEFRF